MNNFTLTPIILTPIILKQLWPEKPKYVSDVNVPAGTRIRTGRVESNYEPVGGGGKGATQYQLLTKLGSNNFINKRSL